MFQSALYGGEFSTLSIQVLTNTYNSCALFGAVLGLLCLIAPAAATALFSLCVAGNNLAWGIPIFCRVCWGNDKFKPGPFYTG
jgi:hypothetical protein